MDCCEKFGYGSVKEFSGHGIGGTIFLMKFIFYKLN